MKKITSAAMILVLLAVFLPMTASAADTFTLHAAVPDSWEDPGFYGWGGSLTMTWPGEAMTDEGNGWYSYEVSADAEGLIVNANGGSVQTPDIKDFEAKDMWVVINSDTTLTVHYEPVEILAPEPAVSESDAAEEKVAESDVSDAAANNFFADNIWYFVGGAAIVAACAAAGAVIGSAKGRKAR